MDIAYLVTENLSKQVSDQVSLVSKVVWPALATLVPVGVTAAFKWAQEHSGGKMRVQLTERVSVLAKAIAELPAEPEAAGLVPTSTLATTPHSALKAELEAVLRELTALQARAATRRVTPGFSAASAVTKVRSALLLYKPKGATAWLLHLSFFSYLAVLVFFVWAAALPTTPSSTDNNPAPAIAADKTTAHQGAGDVISAAGASDTFTNVVAFVFVFSIAGIPPIIIRYYAARIHRKQTALLHETLQCAPATVPAT